MPKQPLVSIIIPTYNRAHLIGETLDSVLAQTYPNWECIVVDDGSTDDTETLLQTYIDNDVRFQYHRRPDTHLPGGNGARNYGFEISNGAFIQWFDSDDVMLPEFLSAKLAGFTTQAIEFVICTGYNTDENLKSQTLIPLSESQNLYKDYAQIKFIALTPSILFKKSFLNEIDLFDETLVRGQEMDFFLRLFYFKTAEQYQIINKRLFLYRQHDKTKTVEDKRYNPLYKDSQTRIYIANLERSVALQDKDLIIMFYRSLLNYFFAGLNHKHYNNSTLILKKLPRIMGVVSARLKFELRLLGAACMLFKHPFYRIHLRLKYHPALKRL
ncbi:glycosyltransferase family 2 protein [Hanstruepera flava]|uniref:glycosyltransferase family 2 protein n=1 Tax=Hanstruepera flava TaxID=2930218 RepID=UPI002027D59F|nr:glycosyltransferase family 2 protein [Hanstruepera flava]